MNGYKPENLDCFSTNAADLEQLSEVYRHLATYAHAKACAMIHRSEGLLNFAADNEAQCERIYQALPKWAQW